MKFYVRSLRPTKINDYPAKLGTEPVEMECPKCGVNMETEAIFEIPVSSHIAACVLCILFCPLAWMPYYFGKYRVTHKCSACDAHLGSYIYNRLSNHALDYSHIQNTSTSYPELRMSQSTLMLKTTTTYLHHRNNNKISAK